MKVNYTLYLVLFLASSIYCQDRQKNFLIGGDFNISHSRYDNPNGYQPSGSPLRVAFAKSERFSYYLLSNIGKIINDKSVVGVFGSYGDRHWEYYSELENGEVYYDDETHDNNYHIGLFYRRNIFTIAKARFFLQPMLSYINRTEKGEGQNEFLSTRLDSIYGLDFSIDSGVSITLANKWTLLIRLPILSYTSTIETSEREYDSYIYDATQDKAENVSFELNLRNIRIGVERLF